MKKKRVHTKITKAILLRSIYGCILLIFSFICLGHDPALAVGFITEEEFASDRSIYKNYPLKLLFKKLAEGDASEKREIKTLIILKQVFDRNGKAKAGVLKESFGIVQDISKEKLRLWIPSIEGHRDYHVGIDRIPFECNEDCDNARSKISDYAVKAYTLDGRIYKIKIDFALTVPTGFYARSEKDLDRKKQILLAMDELKAQNYILSMNHFMKVFSKQVIYIERGGKNHIFGILGLPVECRAEILLLIELSRLKKKNENKDVDVIRAGLEEINERIENREGLWVIIRDESKIKKVQRHIENFNMDSF